MEKVRGDRIGEENYQVAGFTERGVGERDR